MSARRRIPSTRRLLLALFVALAPCVAATAQAQPKTRSTAQAPSPKDFLEGIYARYVSLGEKEAAGVSLATPADVRRWFAPPLARLILDDRARADARKEVPNLDGDPFVDAQEWHIAKVGIAIDTQEKTSAKATVRFTNFDQPKVIHLDLVHGDTGWRVAEARYDDRSLSAITKGH